MYAVDPNNPLPAEFTTDSTVLYERFTAASVAAWVVCEIPSLLLQRIFTCSPFIAEYAIREPTSFVADCSDKSHRARSCAELVTLVDDCLNGCDELSAYSALRRLRYRELARIAWYDLIGLATLENVLSELSALADTILLAALRWLTKIWNERYGTPLDDSGQPQQLLILAMGKLGGKELNFSSDIDLIFLYRSAGETVGGSLSISAQEYFDRLGKKLISLLADVTADGFVYRVDMRLRPFGESGALTVSLRALEHYYEIHGRDWERYALIKGRAVVGDPRDVAAFAQIARPFVYRRYLDFGAITALREMKALINAEIARHDLQHDIKRGPGGIREIEFIGQLFQLTRGGRETRLREHSIIAALMHCRDLGLLPAHDVTALCDAYRLLRITEHRLQQVHDRQTHHLPTNDADQSRLAFSMGFSAWSELDSALVQHRDRVKQIFANTLNHHRAEGHIVTGDISPSDEHRNLLTTANFSDVERAQNLLSTFGAPRFTSRLSQEARIRLDALLPSLVNECAQHKDGVEALARVTRLVQAVARRSVYLVLLTEHPNALSRLVALCAASAWIAREITANPILLDELLDHRQLFLPPQQSSLRARLHETLEAVAADDLEGIMDRLRQFKHQQVLNVAASDLLAGFPVAEVSNHLSWIAETLLNYSRNRAWQELTAKHGIPVVIRETERPIGFAIIAYGKLGGLELGYASDLDLVFIHDGDDISAHTNGPKPLPIDLFFSRLAQRIIHLLSTRTAAGIAYELDMRLRPSGSAGLLVTSLRAFATYQQQDAWTWEHQALVRARAVSGMPDTMSRFTEIRREILSRPRNSTRLRDEVVNMRARLARELDRGSPLIFDLKHGLGGITDVEFMVQYAVLRWAHEYPTLCTYTDNLRLLEAIAELALFSREESEALRAAYFAYRAELHRCALQEIDGLVDASFFADERRAVMEVWARVMQKSILDGK